LKGEGASFGIVAQIVEVSTPTAGQAMSKTTKSAPSLEPALKKRATEK
jgi:hypothetical protein